MIEHTNVQIIKQDGNPAFAIIPWDDFQAIEPALKRHRALRDGIPHAVVQRMAIDGLVAIRAWREHLGLEQSTVAEKAGMKQPALARIEKGGSKPQSATLKRIAKALGLTLDQIDFHA